MALPKPHRFTGEAWDAEVELLVPRRQILYPPATGRLVRGFPTKPDW